MEKVVCSEVTSHFTAAELDKAVASSRKMQFLQRIQQQLSELQFELEES
jgi:hypothetical protein